MRTIDVVIQIRALAAAGYPVEASCDAQVFPTGYLRPDVLPWLPSHSREEDGARLFGLLFADQGPRDAWATAAGSGVRRRVRLRIDNDAPELHAIPWELLRDPAEGATPSPLAADVDTPFSRFLAVRQPDRPPVEERPIRILAAVASPSDLRAYQLDPLDVVIEQQLIADAVGAAPPGEAELAFVPQPVTLAALEELLGQGFHVLHLVAHGVRPTEGAPVLFLADASNHVVRVPARELAELLERRGGDLRLVVLASCQTATADVADVFRGFAPRLVAAGIPAVVAMQDRVSIVAARAFTSAFYPRLLAEGLVDLAGNVARSALISHGDGGSYAVPVVFSRVPDGRIFVPPPVDEQPSLPERVKRSLPWRIGAAVLAVVSVLAMLIGLVVDLEPYCRPGGALYPLCRVPPEPMPDGFNIIVTPFAAQSESGRITDPTDTSQAVGDLLYRALVNDAAIAASASAPIIRGPTEAGPLDGADRDAYAQAAADAAEQQNATILVYGVVVPTAEGLAVELNVHVRDPGFTFGGELAGPGRLGPPVPIKAPVDDASLAGANARLRARLDALRRMVVGQSEFRAGNYDAAYAKFVEATFVPGWRDDEGKELAYMLIGAARLRQINPEQPIVRHEHYLAEAEQAFEEARRLQPRYARSYIGLGNIAIARADIALNTGASGDLAAQLVVARQYFEEALKADDLPEGAFIPAKADYGLGQAHLIGFNNGIAGWSLDEAETAFQDVVETYKETGSDNLLWIAGNAHANLAYAANLRDDWATMAGEGAEAIALLERMPGAKAQPFIAHYWTYVGYAERRRGNVQACQLAYDRAIDVGAGVVDEEDLARWRELRRCEA